MDFLKKFFDNLFQYLIDTASGLFFGLVLMLRHPITGPQVLARRHRAEVRGTVEPNLFLFLSCVIFLLYLFLGDFDFGHVAKLVSEGKPDPKLSILAASGFVLAAAIILSLALARWALRFATSRRAAWNGKVPREGKLSRTRLAALPYAVVLSLFLCVLIGFVIVQTDVIRSQLSLIILDWLPPFAGITFFTIPLPGIGGEIPITSNYILLMTLAGLVFLPALWPLARLLVYPDCLMKALTTGQRCITALSGVAAFLFGLAPVILSLVSYWALSAPRAEPKLNVSHMSCDLGAWPRLIVSLHVENALGTPMILPADALWVSIHTGKAGDIPPEPLAQTTVLEPLQARIIALHDRTELPVYALEKAEAGLMLVEAIVPQSHWNAEAEDGGLQCQLWADTPVEPLLAHQALNRATGTVNGRPQTQGAAP